ncbi:MAG: hypothetical protein GQ582_03925 [Methyloprofundus sp.]|nr:hypothetical protein [Methyloprofundus sp.]
MDGEKGLKNDIKFDALKSVDYIELSKLSERLILVEFSDLYSQTNEINKQITALKQCKLENSQKKAFLTKLGSTIQKELTDKYKDTRLIIEQMQHEKFYSELNLHKTVFYVVIAPFHKSIAKADKVEIARRLDDLESNIDRCLPGAWDVKVKLVSITQFSSA